MSDQLTLDIGPLVDIAPVAGESLDDRFDRWINANTWVLDVFIQLTEAAHTDGAQRVGAKHVVEVMRWEHRRATQGDEFKLNNSYTSRLARLAVSHRPDLAPLFETRCLRS